MCSRLSREYKLRGGNMLVVVDLRPEHLEGT